MFRYLLVAIFSVTSVFAGTLSESELLSKPKDQLTPEEQELRRQITMYRRTGGIIYRREANPGAFAIVNASKTPDSVYEQDFKEIEHIFRIDFIRQHRDSVVSINTARQALKETKANAALFIVEDENNPEIFISSPEGRFGILNLTALRRDAADEATVTKRIRREFWRAFSIVAGSYTTEMQHCLLNPIYSLGDLDDFDGNTISPEPITRIVSALKKMGIHQYTKYTYRTACRKGWAAAPTNAVQQAIWDYEKAQLKQKAQSKSSK